MDLTKSQRDDIMSKLRHLAALDPSTANIDDEVVQAYRYITNRIDYNTLHAVNIEYDVDDDCDESVSLPDSIEIPFDIIAYCSNRDEITDAVSDYIANETGFCHNGFVIE